MAKDKKHPLTFFREQYQKRAKNLKKYQVDGETDGETLESPSSSSTPSLSSMMNNSQNLNFGYNREIGRNSSVNINAGADVGGKKIIANPKIDASMTKGNFSGGVSYDPNNSNKIGAKITYKKGPFNISVGTHKKGGSTKSKKKK